MERSTEFNDDVAEQPRDKGASDSQTKLNTHREKIYAEAAQWVRVGNSILWTIAAIFIPFSLSPLVALIAHPLLISLKWWLLGASLIISLGWLWIDHRYTSLITNARAILMKIEGDWELPPDLCMFAQQHQIINRSVSVTKSYQIGCTLVVGAWIVVLLHQKEIIESSKPAPSAQAVQAAQPGAVSTTTKAPANLAAPSSPATGP